MTNMYFNLVYASLAPEVRNFEDFTVFLDLDVI